MSFKRDGDDRAWLNLLQKRRISELLSFEIPEEEALLTKNGRFACLVCGSKPIFDTVNILAVHRSGKRHQMQKEKYLLDKEDFNALKLARRHEEYNKFGKIVTNELENDDSEEKKTLMKCLGSAPYNPRVKKSFSKKTNRKPRIFLHESESCKEEAASNSSTDIYPSTQPSQRIGQQKPCNSTVSRSGLQTHQQMAGQQSHNQKHNENSHNKETKTSRVSNRKVAPPPTISHYKKMQAAEERIALCKVKPYLSKRKSQDSLQENPTRKTASIHHMTQVSGHMTQVSDHMTGVSSHMTQVSDHMTQVSDHMTQVSDRMNRVSDHMTQVSGHITQVSDHMIQVSGHMTQVSDRMTQVSDRTTGVSDRMTQVSDRMTQVSDHMTQVSDRMTGVSDRMTQVSDHTTQGSDHATQGSNDRERVLNHLASRLSAQYDSVKSGSNSVTTNNQNSGAMNWSCASVELGLCGGSSSNSRMLIREPSSKRTKLSFEITKSSKANNSSSPHTQSNARNGTKQTIKSSTENKCNVNSSEVGESFNVEKTEAKREAALKYLKAIGSGWKKDRSGNWVKDEDAEFDSDDEPPDI